MQIRVARLVALLVLAGVIFFWWKKQFDQRNSFLEDADAQEIWDSGNDAAVTTPKKTQTPPAYEFSTASADGIGKRFMGREIAKVMGHPAIGWLEREEREREEAPSKALLALQLRPTDVIADIGAGSGYYAFRMTNLVPQGSVVALDIQQEMIDFVNEEAAKKGVKNLRTHLGKIDDVALPEASIDAALMVDAYHEFSHPAEMLRSLHRALKADGRIYLLEFRAEDPLVPIKPLHKMTEAQAVAEFSALGFQLLSNRRHLPWQHFMVFGKAK
jgi:ubiquinone/menaquinone biosynthesis C-methylase UbiE